MRSFLATKSVGSTRLIHGTAKARFQSGVIWPQTVEDGLCSRGDVTDQWTSIATGREYRSGFGDLNGEFWLGLDKIHRLATDQTLRVDLADFDNVKKYAHYDSFTVGPRSSDYVLYMGKYTGNAGDSIKYHDGKKFATADNDNDADASRNCAETFKGAWWYGACHDSNLNGQYLKGQHSSFADGVNWLTFKGHNYSLKFTEMKIKPQ